MTPAECGFEEGGRAMSEIRMQPVRMQQVTSALLVLTFALGACSAGGASGTGNGSTQAAAGAADAAASQTQPSGPFRAVATSAISVDLSWDPVDGATGYRIENQFGDSEWITIAELGGDELTYEDFLTPAATELNYRLTPLLIGEEGEVLTTNATTPEEVPNPYAVVATLEEPDYGSVSLDIPGFDPSTFDPSTFDPSTLDLSGIDNGDLDLSGLAPKPVSATARLGPSGGSLSVTGKNGVVYTLDVPPDALTFETSLILTPVAQIDGYPFDGGWLAAVQIWPEGIYFDVPAKMTIEMPDDVLAAQSPGDDLVEVDFAFERGGEEFHLIPGLQSEQAQSLRDGGHGKVAAPMAQSTAINGWGQVPIPRTGTVGRGRGRKAEARKFTRSQSPSRGSDQAAQKSAASHLDEYGMTDADYADAEKRLEELRPEAVGRYREIMGELQAAGEAGDVLDFLNPAWSDLLALLDDADVILALPDEYFEPLMNRALDMAYKLLVPEECPSAKAAGIQELVRRLRRPDKGMESVLAHAFRDRFGQNGQDLLNSLNAVSSCKVKLSVSSNATVTEPLGSIKMRIVASDIPLAWRYDGRPFLQQRGDSGKIVYDPLKITGECTEIDVKSLQGSEFTVVDLTPIFGPEGDLADWDLQDYVISGFQSEVTAACLGGQGRGYTAPGQPNDLWGGTVLLATPGFKQILGRRHWASMGFLPGSQPDDWWSDEATSTNTSGPASATHTTEIKLLPQR
jgi:hypothetical protein